MIGVAREQLKILKAVVVMLAILVVNNLLRCQISSEMILHHKTMLWNVFSARASSMWMPRRIEKNVAVFVDQTTASPAWMTFSRTWTCPLCTEVLASANP
jgi:hypothetical protein